MFFFIQVVAAEVTFRLFELTAKKVTGDVSMKKKCARRYLHPVLRLRLLVGHQVDAHLPDREAADRVPGRLGGGGTLRRRSPEPRRFRIGLLCQKA